MATYIIINILFLLSISALLLWKRRWRIDCPMIVTLVMLLVFTLVFDSLIIALDICRYDTSKLLGIRIGLAPIEDFFYALLAGIMVPMLWSRKREVHDERKK